MAEESKEDVYTLTPLGLLGNVIGDDAAKEAIDALTLYMIRGAKPGCFMGLVADGGHLSFVQVAKE